MTPKKIGKKSRKKGYKSREMTFTDTGPWAKGELGVRQRIAYALRVWCADQGCAPSSAYEPLSIGWCSDTPLSISTVDNLVGLAYAKHPESRTLGNVRTIWALCDRIGVSAEWIFTGIGPKARRTIAEGGRLSQSEFAQELAAHVMTACADVYGIGVTLHCDAEKLLDTITLLVRREAQADMSTFGVRQAEFMANLKMMYTATKYGTLVADNHPDRQPIDHDLFTQFRLLREQMVLAASTSRLPIIQEEFRKAMKRGAEMFEEHGSRA